MPLLKLSPLQSRFAASVVALLFLGFVYFSLTRPQFAYALEIDSIVPSDHNHPIIFDHPFDDDDHLMLQHVADATQTNLLKRQGEEDAELSNNAPLNKDISNGQTQIWLVGSKVLQAPPGEVGKGLPSDNRAALLEEPVHNELRRRQSNSNLYITVNVCTQPRTNMNSSSAAPPQLTLYYAPKSLNQQPGPTSSPDSQTIEPLDGGYVLVNISPIEDIYVAIAAQNQSGIVGSWNYEIAASIDAPYHQFEKTPNLHFVDADNQAALLITDDLTKAPSNATVYRDWMELDPPYGMFAHDQSDKTILGVSKSYCGLMNEARVVANRQNASDLNVVNMTTRGVNAKPKEQFYITNLNASSTYWGFLAMQGNSTASGMNVVGGGGKVWAAIDFKTKSAPNCALMYNLSFCSEVAYAVPSNPDLKYQELATIYDSHAQGMFQFFNFSLQQIPCQAPPTSQYSLARNCDDCAAAYKSWLCAVTIPRCEDFNNTSPWLKIRNAGQPWPNGSSIDMSLMTNSILVNDVATNRSRNQIIDDVVKPGLYKEVLPCEDLCYDLVKSCPAALGFGCPQTRAGLNNSYGFRTGDGGEITCSYLGAAYNLGGSGRTVDGVHLEFLIIWASILALFLF